MGLYVLRPVLRRKESAKERAKEKSESKSLTPRLAQLSLLRLRRYVYTALRSARDGLRPGWRTGRATYNAKGSIAEPAPRFARP